MGDRAGSRFFKSQNDFGGGRFPAAAFTCQGKYLRRFHIEGNMIRRSDLNPGKYVPLVVFFGQLVNFKQIIHFRLLRSTSRPLYG